jgi:hypothetical protein
VFKRLCLLLAYFSFACSPTLADLPVKHAPAIKVAPADMYFGKLKMSVLGIQNVIKDMRLRVLADADKTPSIFGSLALVEDAMHDWEKQFPKDSWIAKDLLALEITYLSAPGEKAHGFAVRTEAWLRRDYGRTQYALQGHNELVKATLAASAAQPSPPPANVQATSDGAPTSSTH